MCACSVEEMAQHALPKPDIALLTWGFSDLCGLLPSAQSNCSTLHHLVGPQPVTRGELGRQNLWRSPGILQRLWKFPFVERTWRPGGTFVRHYGHRRREKWNASLSSMTILQSRDIWNSALYSGHFLASGKAMTSMSTKACERLFLT